MINILFGSQNDFVAKYKEGYLCIVCGGGTGYAINIPESLVEKKLQPILKATEDQIIKYCEHNYWYFYNYYSDELFSYNKNKKYFLVYKFKKPFKKSEA